MITTINWYIPINKQTDWGKSMVELSTNHPPMCITNEHSVCAYKI